MPSKQRKKMADPVAEWLRMLILSALNRLSSAHCGLEPSLGHVRQAKFCFLVVRWFFSVISHFCPTLLLSRLRMSEIILTGCKTQIKGNERKKNMKGQWSGTITCHIPPTMSNGKELETSRKGTKLHNWAATWQNQQNGICVSEDSDMPGRLPSLIRVFSVHMKKAWVLSYPLIWVFAESFPVRWPPS